MSTASKVMLLSDAIASNVRAGDHIHVAYNEARPNGVILQLVRQFAGSDPSFTLSTGGLTSSQGSLVSECLLKKVIASFIGDNYPTGAPNPLFQSAIDNGLLEVEETSLWTLVARLMAGALGLSYLPVNSLGGSDLQNESWSVMAPDPFNDGSKSVVVKAINPDIVLVHAVASDDMGNLILSPPLGEVAWGALASRRGVIATVERVLPRERVRAYQSLVQIPSHSVRAVCPLPLGAHPYALFSPIPEVPSYVEDEAFILEQRRACADREEQRRWVEKWVTGTKDHDAYLRQLGRNRANELLGAAATNVWSYFSDPIDDTEGATPTECMVVAAARHLQSRVKSSTFDVIMTGIGQANLAAWLTHHWLQAEGINVPLMAEIGAYGYEPRPGDPFIFSHRNLPTCSWMTDVAGVLGAVVGGRQGRTLATVGAGMVDQCGNINSNRTESGGYLVGSGGANDIASAADELVVVVRHGQRRLPETVPYVTCPGDNVTAIVTDRAILMRRTDGEFELSELVGTTERIDSAVRNAKADCGWDLPVANTVGQFHPVAPEDLHLLRSYDPHHAFLPRTKRAQ